MLRNDNYCLKLIIKSDLGFCICVYTSDLKCIYKCDIELL